MSEASWMTPDVRGILEWPGNMRAAYESGARVCRCYCGREMQLVTAEDETVGFHCPYHPWKKYRDRPRREGMFSTME